MTTNFLVQPTTRIPAPFELSRMSVSDLREQVGRAVAMTAESIAYLASVWVELERRGEDMSDLKISLAPFLRDVAAGRLAPEAVLSFAGQKMMLRWVARRPVAEQLSLAAGNPVTIVEDNGDKRVVRPNDLSVFDLRQIESRPSSVTITTDAAPEAQAAPQPPAPKPRKAEKAAMVPVSDAEYEIVVRSARDAGLSISNFLRSKLGFELRYRHGSKKP